MAHQYLAATWTDPRQEIRPSALHGYGIFARQFIPQGEVVEIIGGQVMSAAQFSAFQKLHPRFNAVQIGEDLHLVELPEVTAARSGSINHACDSNLWLTDEVTLVARWDIAAGEELTVDYALFTVDPSWVMDQACLCGSPRCRHTITGNDWQLLDVQNRYHDHFSPFIQARFAQLGR